MTNEAKIIGGIGILTVIILFAGVFFFSGGNGKIEKPVDNSSIIKQGNYSTGSKTAKVTVVEFADFQCPACARVHPIIKQILEEYTSDMRFVYRHFPLPQHKNAKRAARASEAAGEQNKFWEMYDLLYENQNTWSENDGADKIFIGYAKQLQLNTEKFEKSLRSDKFDSKIQEDLRDGQVLGVNSTPTIFINNKKQNDVFDYASFKKLVEEEIK